METMVVLTVVVLSISIPILAFCLFISPLMIWKHTKATSKKLDQVIALLKK